MSEQCPVPKVTAVISVAWRPCRQVNSHCYGPALLLLCVQRTPVEEQVERASLHLLQNNPAPSPLPLLCP